MNSPRDGDSPRNPSDRVVNVQLTQRERATVLAALRFHRDEHLQAGSDIPDLVIAEIAADGGRLQPLSGQEVDRLCERLNVAPLDDGGRS